MKLKLIAVVILCTVLIIGACKKDEVFAPDFTTITQTDSNGHVNGTVDSSDWSYDEFWNGTELNFLAFKDTSTKSTDTLSGSVSVSPAMTNPNAGLFILGLNPERQVQMKYAVVNTDLRVLHYGSRKLNGGLTWLSFDLTTNTAVRKGEYYRMYYGFYNGKDSLYYKGHGDIKIE